MDTTQGAHHSWVVVVVVSLSAVAPKTQQSIASKSDICGEGRTTQ